MDLFDESYSRRIEVDKAVNPSVSISLYYYEEGAAGTGQSTRFIGVKEQNSEVEKELISSDFLDSLTLSPDTLKVFLSKSQYELYEENQPKQLDIVIIHPN